MTTTPQQLHDNSAQISVKVVKLSSFEVSKNSGKTFARSTTLSEGERIGCERPLVTLGKTKFERTLHALFHAFEVGLRWLLRPQKDYMTDQVGNLSHHRKKI